MKFNIKTKIDVREFIPSRIIPRSGSFKKLGIIENEDTIMLSLPRCKKTTFPREIYLDSDDFIAVGLYLAEGETYYNPDNQTKHSGEMRFVNSNPDCIILLSRLLNKLQISTNSLSWKVGLNINYKDKINKRVLFNYWVKRIKLNKDKARPKWLCYTGRIGGRITSNTHEKGYLEISFASTIFRNFFINFVQKIFEDSIRDKSKEKLALILKGFFAGDGSVDYSDKYKRKQLEFLTNDINLLNKIRKSLTILGLTSIRETWPELTKTHTKSLRIYNKHDFKILANYDIPNLVDYKRETFSKIINSL